MRLARSLVPVACSMLLAACGGSSGSDASDPGDPGVADGGKETPWPGNPCTLLTAADFAPLTNNYMLNKAEPHNLNTTFSPDCRFYLQGNGSSAAVGVFVDLASDYEIQKAIFKGEPVPGLGKSAWRGNAGGPGNSTIGVLVDKWSFRVDSTYEYKYADLMPLAMAIASRLK